MSELQQIIYDIPVAPDGRVFAYFQHRAKLEIQELVLQKFCDALDEKSVAAMADKFRRSIMEL